MLDWIVLVVFIVLACFSFVLLVGPPYLPTLTKQVGIAMDLVDLQPGQTLLELGCGDGKILLAAAARGYKAVGYELNPLLVLLARLRTWRYRKQVRVVWGNLWHDNKWDASADGIFVFILQKHMATLDKKIVAWHKRPIKLVSFAFPIPGKPADESRDGVYLYLYK